MIDFDPQERAFFEYIKEDIPDLDEKLFEEIDSLGIETVEQWEDAYAVCPHLYLLRHNLQNN